MNSTERVGLQDSQLEAEPQRAFSDAIHRNPPSFYTVEEAAAEMYATAMENHLEQISLAREFTCGPRDFGLICYSIRRLCEELGCNMDEFEEGAAGSSENDSLINAIGLGKLPSGE